MNIAEKLAREVVRVTAIRCRWQANAEELSQRGVNANLKPGIALMGAAIENGCLALGAGDALQTMRALHDLEGFTE